MITADILRFRSLGARLYGSPLVPKQDIYYNGWNVYIYICIYLVLALGFHKFDINLQKIKWASKTDWQNDILNFRFRSNTENAEISDPKAKHMSSPKNVKQ